MPISNKNSVSKNIKKLVSEKPGKSRKKAISTLAKNKGISPKEAKQLQAVAIALSARSKK